MNVLIIVLATIRFLVFGEMEVACAINQMPVFVVWDKSGTFFLISMIVIYFVCRLVYFACTKAPLRLLTKTQKIVALVIASIEGGSSFLLLLFYGLEAPQKPWLLMLLQVYILFTGVLSFSKAYRTRV